MAIDILREDWLLAILCGWLSLRPRGARPQARLRPTLSAVARSLRSFGRATADRVPSRRRSARTAVAAENRLGAAENAVFPSSARPDQRAAALTHSKQRGGRGFTRLYGRRYENPTATTARDHTAPVTTMVQHRSQGHQARPRSDQQLRIHVDRSCAAIR